MEWIASCEAGGGLREVVAVLHDFATNSNMFYDCLRYDLVMYLKLSLIFALCSLPIAAQNDESVKKPVKKPNRAFSWSSPPTENAKWLPKGVKHVVFKSPSMGIDVGYYIYLPPSYETEPDAKFPVVYHLHGGRPGAEAKSIRLAEFPDAAIREGKLRPTVYVYPNGGPMSWYNFPSKENGLGEDVFVKELLPHIDETYRTLGKAGRGIEGFSQGGRGTTRIMFKYPELWASAAPGGSGYEPEKRISDNDGYESETLRFLPIGYNAWDLAKKYAATPDRPVFPILLWVGTKGFNYEFNLKFSDYLNELGVAHEKLIAPDIAHSAKGIYEIKGLELMKFHEQNFAANEAR